jgi:uncharacterized protein
MNPANVLILPGWQNSGPGHWQTLWEHSHGYLRVEQHDWMRPLRGDWSARLEEVVLSCSGPIVLVAHSLGCILTAAWASHSQNTHRVKGALLVAPPDAERDDIRQMVPGWSPVPLERLPFESVLFASSNDPFCTAERAQQFAAAWGATFVDAGSRGHLNADSGLGDWPEAHARLVLLQNAGPSPI